MTKDDFMQWKSEPVTKKLFALIRAKIELGMEELSYCAGSDPLTDKERVGKFAAYRDVLEFSFTDIEDDEDVD